MIKRFLLVLILLSPVFAVEGSLVDSIGGLCELINYSVPIPEQVVSVGRDTIVPITFWRVDNNISFHVSNLTGMLNNPEIGVNYTFNIKMNQACGFTPSVSLGLVKQVLNYSYELQRNCDFDKDSFGYLKQDYDRLNGVCDTAKSALKIQCSNEKDLLKEDYDRELSDLNLKNIKLIKENNLLSILWIITMLVVFVFRSYHMYQDRVDGINAKGGNRGGK